MSFFFSVDPSAPVEAPERPSGARLLEVLGPYLNPGLLEVLQGESTLVGPECRDIDPIRVIKENNLKKVLLSAAEAPLPREAPKLHPEFGWLAFYLEGSTLAADDIEQRLWGRLLANEVHEPGTVSKRTLQFLKTMDLWEVHAFSEFSAFSFSFESGWRFMIANEVAHREMWSYGREIDMTQHWVNIGLLESDVVSLESSALRGLRVGYRQKSWALSLSDHQEGESLLYRKFTAMGQQLADGCTLKTFNGFARNLIKALQQTSRISFEELGAETPVNS